VKVENTVGLITGGASGLGEGAVRMLVEGGGKAAILDLPSSKGEEIAESLGDSVIFVPADITDTDEVEQAVKATVGHFGRLDLTVNAAGIAPAQRVVGKDSELFPLDLFKQVIDVNLVGLFDVVRWSARYMAENEPGPDGECGLIVNVASIAAYEGQVGQAAYTASKGGVASLTLQLARDFERQKIRVMAIAPGIMDTAMLAGIDEKRREALIGIHLFPKRLGTPADFGRLVEAFMECTLLNADVVRLDAGTRLATR
jgi:3-hydroxyacyl-CoA dehydrogenase/3-hydroxy-2-methylbutyryl-CoA dehydrogenase